MLGKHNCQRLQSCCYDSSFIVFKKCAVLATYFSIIVATIVFLYYCIWILNIRRRLCTNDETFRATKKDSYFDREKERTSYNQLLHYILHPRAHCEAAVVLGGQVMVNKKLDGDKVVCLDPGRGFGEECIVYSFGINNEWSFEEGMHKKFGCSLYAFDPSMNEPDHLHSKGIWFFNQGIGQYNKNITVHGQVWEMKTLDSIIDRLSHRDKTIDMLKMDIEGTEREVLEDILDKGLLNHINHLCVEIHLYANPHWTEMLNLLQRIETEAGLKHFSTRNNTQAKMKQVPGFPERYEQHFFEMAWYRD